MISLFIKCRGRFRSSVWNVHMKCVYIYIYIFIRLWKRSKQKHITFLFFLQWQSPVTHRLPSNMDTTTGALISGTISSNETSVANSTAADDGAMARLIYQVGLSLILPMGVTGNILILVILKKPSLRKYSTSCYLSCIAVSTRDFGNTFVSLS